MKHEHRWQYADKTRYMNGSPSRLSFVCECGLTKEVSAKYCGESSGKVLFELAPDREGKIVDERNIIRFVTNDGTITWDEKNSPRYSLDELKNLMHNKELKAQLLDLPKEDLKKIGISILSLYIDAEKLEKIIKKALEEPE